VTSTRDDYRTLIADQPGLFSNPDGTPIQILLNETEIRAAEAKMAAQLRANGLPESWATVGVVFQDQYMRVLRDAVRFLGGDLGTYIRTVPAQAGVPGVIVLPVYKSSIVLVRHFRHATRAWHLEIPRGFGSVGSTPEDDARREILEEVSGICKRLEPLGPVHLDTGLGAGVDMLFYAELESLGAHDRHEGIGEVLTVSVAEFRKLIATGEVTDGFTLAAYARATAADLM
jgi:ADP-ribose pyrophosphatase